MRDRDLDEAIDRAVQDIMSAEPRAGMRGRVLERLSEPPRSPLIIVRFAGAVACALVLLALAFTYRASDERTASSTIVSHQPSAAPANPAPAATVAAPEAVPPRVAGPVATNRPIPRPPSTVVRAASVDDDERGLAALAKAPPLAVAAIEETRLETRELAMGALSVEPITVEPLPPDGTNNFSREDPR